MKKATLIFLLLSILFMILNCSQEVTGGGLDVGNPNISGVILTDKLTGVESTAVYLLPSHFNPKTDILDTLLMKTVTDKDGAFQFTFDLNINTDYTLWSIDTINNKSHVCYRNNITIKDTAKALYSILERAVDLIVFIPDSINTDEIYTYIPGTPYQSIFLKDSLMGDSILMLSSIPQGLIPRINISENNQNSPVPLTDTLRINSDSIQLTTAFEVWSNFSSDNSIMTKDTVYSVFKDSKGVYWFGTFGGGIYSVKDQNWKNYTKKDGLYSNVNLCFGEDSAGNIWCGTGQGIAYVNEKGVTLFDTSLSTVPKNGVFEFEIDESNRIWIASGDGVYLYDHGNWTLFDTSNSNLPQNLVYSVAWRNDSLFAGTFGGGLAIYSSQGWDTLTVNNSLLPSNYIYTVKIDSDNTIWLGTSKGIAIYKNGDWTLIKDELPHENVWALAPDNRGGAWIGTQSGIVRYKNGVRNIYTIENSTFLSTHTFAITSNEFDVMFGTRMGVTVVEYDN